MRMIRIVLFAAVSLMACSSNTNTSNGEQAADSTFADSNSAGNNITANTATCYAYTQNKDTIQLSINVSGNTFTGHMLYQLREKDRNEGTLEGTIEGDTLLAYYHFASEGMMSVRQVAFLKKGNSLQEGFGELEPDKNNQYLFKDTNKLQFTGFVLTPVACN